MFAGVRAPSSETRDYTGGGTAATPPMLREAPHRHTSVYTRGRALFWRAHTGNPVGPLQYSMTSRRVRRYEKPHHRKWLSYWTCWSVIVLPTYKYILRNIYSGVHTYTNTCNYVLRIYTYILPHLYFVLNRGQWWVVMLPVAWRCDTAPPLSSLSLTLKPHPLALSLSHSLACALQSDATIAFCFINRWLAHKQTQAHNTMGY